MLPATTALHLSSSPPISERAARVLLVEAVLERRLELEAMLHGEGYETLTLSDADEVLRLAAEYEPDLILLDVDLPGATGLEVCGDLRASDPRRHYPIVLLSYDSPDEFTVAGGLLAGADDFIAAPARSLELRARIRVQLRNKRHLDALQRFASRAYRRPLSATERDQVVAFYKILREQNGLTHEEAIRDSVVRILMSPKFCYRMDMGEVSAVTGSARRLPLSGPALASRLSYFLWSSMPDEQLMAVKGELQRPEIVVEQTRRMLQDPRVRGMATEFAGNWLDFRRFEEHNAVDRERFPTFDNELREAMFQEPVRLVEDVIRNRGSVLDLLYGSYTFVNAVLARHYGMPEVKGDRWVRVDDAGQYGRGGLMPMAVFLTQNAPGLRTSPVKRGYWVVRRVLGENVPPPPASVPELPTDEAKLDLPLRDMLARHRENPSCASCHARFDSFGLAFEGYGPIGESRLKDLAGRPVDIRAVFPDGSEGSGFEGVQANIRQHRQQDFLDNLCRKLLAYALSRSLQLSDEALVEKMTKALAENEYRFAPLVETIVTSPQFLNQRGPNSLVTKR